MKNPLMLLFMVAMGGFSIYAWSCTEHVAIPVVENSESGKQSTSANEKVMERPASSLSIDVVGEPIYSDRRPVEEIVASFRGRISQGDAGAAFQAYRALSICSQARVARNALSAHAATIEDALRKSLESIASRANKVCSHVSDVQLKERLSYLRLAAKAGIPDAQVAFFVEGPTGEPVDYSRFSKDDQVFASWKNDAIKFLEASSLKGNKSAMAMLVQLYSGGDVVEPDPKVALKYAIVQSLAKGLDPSSQTAVDVFSKQLRPDQVREVYSDARSFAEVCCTQKRGRK